MLQHLGNQRRTDDVLTPRDCFGLALCAAWLPPPQLLLVVALLGRANTASVNTLIQVLTEASSSDGISLSQGHSTHHGANSTEEALVKFREALKFVNSLRHAPLLICTEGCTYAHVRTALRVDKAISGRVVAPPGKPPLDWAIAPNLHERYRALGLLRHTASLLQLELEDMGPRQFHLPGVSWRLCLGL